MRWRNVQIGRMVWTCDVERRSQPPFNLRRRARLGCAGRRDRERGVVAPPATGSGVPPGRADPPVWAYPEHVEMAWACHGGNRRTGPRSRRRRDRERSVVAPPATGGGIPPGRTDPSIRANPKHVQMVRVLRDSTEPAQLCCDRRGDRERSVVAPPSTGGGIPPGRTDPPSGPIQKTSRWSAFCDSDDRRSRHGCAWRSDRERSVVAPSATGGGIPPVRANRTVRANPKDVVIARGARHGSEACSLGRAWRSDGERRMVAPTQTGRGTPPRRADRAIGANPEHREMLWR